MDSANITGELDLVSQVRDAILMNVYLEVRNPGGSGFLEVGVYEQEEGNGEFSLQAIGDQGGRILSQLGGFQVSEGDRKGEQGEQRRPARGDNKARRMRHVHIICVRVYK